MTTGPGAHPPPSWRALQVHKALLTVTADEDQYLLHGDRHDPVYLPFMPYHWADFIALLAECVVEGDPGSFCDIGAGPGTKMLLARTLFGLDVHGVEIDPQMAARAREASGGTVTCADALDLPEQAWAAYDIIWMYKPFRDRTREIALEARVYTGMRSGAVFAGGALETFPARWHTVVEDLGVNRGAWRKP